jgi:hypothetical protein
MYDNRPGPGKMASNQPLFGLKYSAAYNQAPALGLTTKYKIVSVGIDPFTAKRPK